MRHTQAEAGRFAGFFEEIRLTRLPCDPARPSEKKAVRLTESEIPSRAEGPFSGSTPFETT